MAERRWDDGKSGEEWEKWGGKEWEGDGRDEISGGSGVEQGEQVVRASHRCDWRKKFE